MFPQNNSADYRKVKDIFMSALEVLPNERAEFLAANCADKNLLAEVESLFEAREQAGEFLNNVSAADTIFNSVAGHDKFIGQKINHYHIEREIGRGGMGVVFLATRDDFHQQAAIKLIKRGMDSDAILERFHREREILAALNHSFIAHLLDGGTTADGLPYCVMEYVEGVPVNEYCKSKNLSEKETLELFRKICEAVQFAHQKLVVHRDLKPSNILITADGTPKLLDFGIAKLLNSTDAGDTQTSQRALTPAYASPEQISGAPVDTTSDVYSLGKILAELLKIRSKKSQSQTENENSKSIFAKIKNTPRSAFRIPRSKDLQNILTMALREESVRRYGSVEKFSEDIRRYLVGLPITARKDTFSYRTAKFIRRKRFAVAVALLFILTLVGGLIATLWQAREARREREIAERRLDNLRKISGSLVTEIHGAIRDLPGSLPARQLLLTHAVEQLDALAAESSDNPALQDELAQAYFNSAQLPDMRLAEKDAILKKEIAIYQTLIAGNSENVHYREQMALGEIALGDITKIRGSAAGALELHQAGVALLEQVVKNEPDAAAHRVNLSNAYLNTATIYILKGDVEAASQMTQKVLTTTKELQKADAAEPDLNQIIDEAQIQIGVEETLAGNYKMGIAELRRMLAEYKIENNKTPNDTRVNYYLWVINRRLAGALEKSGDPSAASEPLQTALSIIESLLAESPKDLGYNRNSAITNIYYGQLLVHQKHPAEAIKYFRRALDLSEKVLENDTDNAESKADLARANANLGNALFLNDRAEEGLDYLNKAVNLFGEICPVDNENAQLQIDYAQTLDWLKAISKQNKQSV
ncbi:MAG: protein kinase domain-containing protein [Pyrinomonadaceae bacterium]